MLPASLPFVLCRVLVTCSAVKRGSKMVQLKKIVDEVGGRL